MTKSERTNQEKEEGALIGFLEVMHALFGTGSLYPVNENSSRKKYSVMQERREEDKNYALMGEEKNDR